MNSHGAFMFQGMPGMPNPATFFSGMPGFQQFNQSNNDGQVMINSHNNQMRVREESQNMTVAGHNNRIEITTTVHNVTITGHNNTIYCSHNATHQGFVDNLMIMGHNNKFQNLTVRTACINGHNNSCIEMTLG